MWVSNWGPGTRPPKGLPPALLPPPRPRNSGTKPPLGLPPAALLPPPGPRSSGGDSFRVGMAAALLPALVGAKHDTADEGREQSFSDLAVSADSNGGATGSDLRSFAGLALHTETEACSAGAFTAGDEMGLNFSAFIIGSARTRRIICPVWPADSISVTL